MYIEAANVVPMKNKRPIAPPNSGPKLREIIKYGPPAGTTPLVAMALILMAVNMVWTGWRNGETNKTSPAIIPDDVEAGCTKTNQGPVNRRIEEEKNEK